MCRYLWEVCHYVKLEPVEIQNAKTSTVSLKRDKYLEKDLMSMFIFSELKAFFANLFSKDSSFSILRIYLHHLGGCIRELKRQI